MVGIEGEKANALSIDYIFPHRAFVASIARSSARFPIESGVTRGKLREERGKGSASLTS